MNSAAERRKHSRNKKAPPKEIRVSFEDSPGHPRTEILATLLDSSDAGFRVAVPRPLIVGMLVFLDRQALNGGGKPEIWTARVTRCSLEEDRSFNAGLTLVAPVETGQGSAKTGPEKSSDGVPDYYEVLQVNPKCDPDTIHRVYRLLAQRFHPDNAETGNAETFRLLLEAYKVLSDPEQRAGYDLRFTSQDKRRWKIFDPASAVRGHRSEKTKRTGILMVLYTRRLNEPAQPAMSIHEMEDLLGCPREHLEFSLWYLREKTWVVRSDNNRFSITAAGVEAAEASDVLGWREHRMLEAGNQ